MADTILSLLLFDITGESSRLLVLVSLVAFVDVNLVSKLVDAAIPSQVHEESASDIFDRPKVKGGQDYHHNERQDLFTNDSVEK